MYQGELVAGGYFSGVDGGLPAHSIARWDGFTWSVMGRGIGTGNICDYQYVFDLEVWEGELHAGGNFHIAGGQPSHRIAVWDGAVWSSLDGIASGDVKALVHYRGELIAGGQFSHAGGFPCNNIASWTGDFWKNLGSGVDDPVTAVCVYDGDLYVSGHFHFAGGKPSWHIAFWSDPSTVVSVPALSAPSPSGQALPNPYRPGDQVNLNLSTSRPVEIDVVDLTGRPIRRLIARPIGNGQVAVRWDGTTRQGLPARSGVYFLSGRAGGWEVRARCLLAR